MIARESTASGPELGPAAVRSPGLGSFEEFSLSMLNLSLGASENVLHAF